MGGLAPPSGPGYDGLGLMEDDDPLWKQILTSEILWVVAAILAVLAAAFFLATSH